jgi:hypothetical protein
VGLRVRWLGGLLVGEDDYRVLSLGFFYGSLFFYFKVAPFCVCCVDQYL